MFSYTHGMHFLFTLVRFFPWWAFPLAFIAGEVGLHFRRKKAIAQWLFFATSGLFATLGVLWFVFRGDLHADRWVRTFLG